MKFSKLVISLMMAFLLVGTVPNTAFAATKMEKIEEQSLLKKEEMVKLDDEISQTLVKVNEKNTELENLQAKIEEKKATIKQTTTEIEEQKKVVDTRLEQAKDRLQTIQTSEVNQNVVVSLFESESVSDLFNRAYVLATLQSAGNDQMDIAKEEQEKLVILQEKVTTEATALEKQTDNSRKQKAELDSQVASLQKTMDDNQENLNKLDKEKKVEETRIAAAKKAEEEAAAAEKIKVTQITAKLNEEKENEKETNAPETNKVASSTQPKTEKKQEPTPTPTPAPTPAPAPAPAPSTGKTMVVSATGYSTAQPGLSTHTATGINLLKNPMVIAVDPRVIPLGTRLEVPGYGIAIAGDTGGAIKGNKIDIHFPTVGQALSWGRKTITIKILN
ncbi:3D domain-containing protein [Carnobacterium funditum]|uniref:3D domain-containing protein n=1 Tax=Carnobacterium funditum TaxID=2752 RepID=UPI000A78ABCD|nr:3D domain-containing protein [Carnobacterium funditum]